MSESHWWYLIHRSEEVRPYNLVYNLAISNPALKAVFSDASPD
jgi:hypothetical protein